jgi:hypothetical protein
LENPFKICCLCFAGQSPCELKGRALSALDYYVGDSRWIRLILDQLGDEI